MGVADPAPEHAQGAGTREAERRFSGGTAPGEGSRIVSWAGPGPARSESRGDVSVAPPAALAVPAMATRLLRGTLRLWGGRAAPCLPPASRCSHSGGEERLETSSAKKLTDIGTRRIFSLEHDIFRESVRKFFQEEVIPFHAEWEKAGEVSRELWEKTGKQGLLGINIADHHGGIGGDLYSSAVVWEELDLQGIRTNAKKDGSDWILNGSKVFVTNGWLCDVVIVVAVTNREAHSPAHGISLFLVENGMKGFIKGRKLDKIGLKAQDTAEFFFEDVRLPAGALLGEENKGFYYLMRELPQERLIISDIAVSASEFMFEETRDYVKQRKAFGKTVADLQTVQHKLAELKTSICVTRAFVDSCLQLHRVKRLDLATAAMAKYWASDLQNRVAYDCLQLHGGWGYLWEYPIAKAYVDARVQAIYGGTNEIMKELIAREIIHDQ
ncbi:long-chain specific acyl-CoA dehydrogenase, mitochondrial isoform X2 [Oryx dammah]|uniref:long-chain specific acyl-CoA dehydrogenase, mitochondrial isoform X2 n=1 Tax=Oryx dammah TaxID=59534 RepID=UPI001A9BFF9A|nr:long-chain specific acyl-CoA dehydrogenase, mitochondrial isoform X2 [Oryx dammah]